jgi:hypothetical protein
MTRTGTGAAVLPSLRSGLVITSAYIGISRLSSCTTSLKPFGQE